MRRRPVGARNGPTQAAAERRLKEALRDRTGPPADGEITAETRLRDAAKLWQAEIAESGTLTLQTREIYERALDRILKAMGGLLMREIDVPRCDAFVKAVRKNHGPSAAKTTRDVLSLLLGMVVRHGALDTNPVREIAKISTRRKTRPKALSREDEAVMLAKVAGDERAAELDAADLIEFLDGTGMRIGEALGVRAEVVDLEAGVLEVNATSVRLKGKGTCLQLRPKTEAGWRVIALPPHLVELCRRRMAMSWPHGDRQITVIGEDDEETQRPAGDVELLFPGLFGGVRNSSNTNRDVKEVLARIEAERFGWGHFAHVSEDRRHSGGRGRAERPRDRRPPRACQAQHDAGCLHGTRRGFRPGGRDPRQRTSVNREYSGTKTRKPPARTGGFGGSSPRKTLRATWKARSADHGRPTRGGGGNRTRVLR
ncbi:hypothetical protein [Actinomadura sp. KC216]|uniref:tyrosine-type recombinase/integrase n=1 Tax=Actinomadura sp. KC216 TaxID=2530370 RepID=UPI001FB63557|nr:hypothetical protein [Actinomadura sp. KC216]